MKRKISYSSYPGLKLLKPDNSRELKIFKNGILKFLGFENTKMNKNKLKIFLDDEFIKKFSSVLKFSRKNVMFLSKNFSEALKASEDNICKCIEERIKLEEGDIFDIICNDLNINNNSQISGIIMGNPYKFSLMSPSKSKEGENMIKKDMMYINYVISREYAIILVINSPYNYKFTPYEPIFLYTMDRNEKKEMSSFIYGNDDFSDELYKAKFIAMIAITLLFKKLTDIEVEEFDVIDETKKPKNVCKALASSMIKHEDDDITIEYLTANWYKKIDVNHEFSVCGHWYNQAYGPKLSLRRIAFRRPSIRHGYHRRAQKEIEGI